MQGTGVMPDDPGTKTPQAVLASGDPHPAELVNPDGRGRVVLICEHAGRLVPTPLGDLGLPVAEFDRHIAWDIGAAGVARALSARLDAPLVMQRYSRLVIDCNRQMHAPDLIPALADGTPVPANADLTPADRQARHDAILAPFHDAVAAVLDARAHRPDTVFLTIHSFTPRLATRGEYRPMELGLLYNRDARLGRALAGAVRTAHPALTVAENAPYRCSDATDYAVPIHAEPRGLLHALVEIRNDQIADAAGQQRWADLLAKALGQALQTLEEVTP